MEITEQQLTMLTDYYNACDTFTGKKRAVMEGDTIKVFSMVAVYHPDENQHMPEEVWEPLELWHMRHRLQVKQWLAADDLPF